MYGLWSKKKKKKKSKCQKIIFKLNNRYSFLVQWYARIIYRITICTLIICTKNLEIRVLESIRAHRSTKLIDTRVSFEKCQLCGANHRSKCTCILNNNKRFIRGSSARPIWCNIIIRPPPWICRFQGQIRCSVNHIRSEWMRQGERICV